MEGLFISSKVFDEIIRNGSLKRAYIIVDLRDKEDYDKFHIDGAVNFEFDRFMAVKNLSGYFDSRKKIILYCDRGGRSLYALKKFNDEGYEKYNVVSLRGGIEAYIKYKEEKQRVKLT